MKENVQEIKMNHISHVREKKKKEDTTKSKRAKGEQCNKKQFYEKHFNV